MAWETYTTDWITHDPVSRFRGVVTGGGHVWPFTNEYESYQGDPLVRMGALNPPLRFEPYAINGALSNVNLPPPADSHVYVASAVNDSLWSYPPGNPFADHAFFERMLIMEGGINIGDSDNYGWCEDRAAEIASTFVPPEDVQSYAVGSVEWEGWENGEPLGSHSDRVLSFYLKPWETDSYLQYVPNDDDGDGWDAVPVRQGEAPQPNVNVILMSDLTMARYYDPSHPDYLRESAEYQVDYQPDYDGDGSQLDSSNVPNFEWSINSLRNHGVHLGSVPADDPMEIEIDDALFEEHALLCHKRYSYQRVTKAISLRLVPQWESATPSLFTVKVRRQYGVTPKLSSTYQPPRYRITYDIYIPDEVPEPPEPVPMTGDAGPVRRRFT